MRLVVVGAGVAGLAAAHRAVELARERAIALDLTVVDARERPGGTIFTERVDGFAIEHGPDSFITEKPWALALCRRIGVEDRLIGTDERHRRVLVWSRGRLHPVPEGFYLLAPSRLLPLVRSPLFSWAGKARMALDLVLPRGGAGRIADAAPDESLGAFVRRRLGAEALERAAQPLAAGIYTADPDDLSLVATMPRFVELERKHRSLILGLWRAARRAPAPASGARFGLFASFRDGMGELVDALVARLGGARLRLGERVGAIAREGGGYAVATSSGEALRADHVVVATEAHAAARLLRYVDPSLAALLEAIGYASSVAVSLGYRRADVPHPLDAFGFVVPRAEKRDLLACTFSSVKYPGRAPEGHVLLRAFLGGAGNAAVVERDDADLLGRVRAELREALGITADPVVARIARHPASMPQYAVGHLQTVAAIEHRLAALPGLHLVGAGYRGVGIADCVRSGEAAAEAALAAAGSGAEAPARSG